MSKKYKKGLFAFSCDPYHLGHEYVIATAAGLCEHLVVAVANNPAKKYLFTIEERLAMVTRALREIGLKNATVVMWEGLTVDLYLREGCGIYFRGVRNEKDVAYEDEQAEMNRIILPTLAVDYLRIDHDAPETRKLRIKRHDLHKISSSNVKMFASGYADISGFVPMFVKQQIEEKLGQRRIAVTGPIAVGKSHVAAAIAGKIPDAMHVNIDQLIRDLYEEPYDGAQIVRNSLAQHFGKKVLTDGAAKVNRRALADKLFVPGADEHRKFVEELTKPHIDRLFRQTVAGHKGLVVMEWAMLAEQDMGHWTNNNSVVVTSRDRAAFLAKREIAPERQSFLDTLQDTWHVKSAKLQKRAVEDMSGMTIAYDNAIADPAEHDASIARLCADIEERCFGKK